MNKLKIALLAAAAVYSAGAMSAEVYKSDGASLSVYGRVKAEVMNGYGYVVTIHGCSIGMANRAGFFKPAS